MASKQQTDLTFAVFQRSELSIVELAATMVKFEAWEQQNLGAAKTSEERLTLWDDTHNGGRLAGIVQENNHVASRRLRAMVSRG
jgi:hypothetical protein